MSSAWYFPSWNGDIRIESDSGDPNYTILTMIEPTVDELRVLTALGELFKEKRWLNKRKKLWNPRGKRDVQSITLPAPLVEIGLYMIAHLKPGVTSLTAVKLEDGTVTAKGSAERGFLSWINDLFSKADGKRKMGSTEKLAGLLESAARIDSVAAKEAAQAIWEKAESRRKKDRKKNSDLERDDGDVDEDKEIEDPFRKEAEVEEEPPKKDAPPKEVKAATVKRPTSCCPRCIPGSIEPASEVLLSFLSDEQHEMWAKERAVIAQGHLTGHRYLISHRHGRHAQRAGKICFDLDDAAVLHFHNSAYPPEEEVLSALLCIEHRENWIRHEATCLGNFDWVFKNPFGDFVDGVTDSHFTGQLGTFIRGFLMTFEGGRFALPEDRHAVGKMNVNIDQLLANVDMTAIPFS